MSVPVRIIQIVFRRLDPVLERQTIRALEPGNAYSGSRAPGDIWIEGDEEGAWSVSVFLAVHYFPPKEDTAQLNKNWRKWGEAAEEQFRREHPDVVFRDRRK